MLLSMSHRDPRSISVLGSMLLDSTMVSMWRNIRSISSNMRSVVMCNHLSLLAYIFERFNTYLSHIYSLFRHHRTLLIVLYSDHDGAGRP